ncbi:MULTISPECIES: transglutaminase family protein [unclassified Sphingobium]|uniref:transglutaminase family protein n=1 Tax=unclassified Sphingobium TaxID=2611147 RepID=UPI002225374A|nr:MULTISPECIES: transglutaminase family protein [unclassified Sphingobium]MCW2394257.1 transglutaminase-like putative cysteine protease [Sphingobium sp. B8D3B]MCW2417771.1 transglutaminase-like putative cysteine protease [Sphingobium sp. B8D3C]
MRITIRHETVYRYEEEAGGVVMRLRLLPATSNAQTVEQWTVTANGQPIERWIINGYGDAEAVWRAPGRVGSVTILSEGTVRTVDCAGVLKPADGAVRPQLFLRATPLTEIDAAIADLAHRARREEGVLASLHALSDLVHEEIEYRSGSTSMETTAAQAFAQKSGVCQDQAHVFIAAARSLLFPARYVVGYLRDDERPDSDHEPHAWAEAWVEGLGWIGFDITLGLCPVEGHVRLCCGLDAADAAPIRGVMIAGGETALSHDVQIASLPSEDTAQSQTQQ